LPTIDRQRWFDSVVGPPLCWLLTLFHRLRGDTRPPVHLRRILVILLSEMGALVLARPMFERLRERHPGAELFVLCLAQNREAVDLADLVPGDHVIGIGAGSLWQFASESLRAVRRLRARNIDVTIDAELFTRVSAIYAGLVAAPIRVGFHRHTQEGLYRGDFMNRPVPYNPYQHIAAQFVTLADAIDSASVPKVKRLVPPDLPRLARMKLRDGELDSARQRLHTTFPALAEKPLAFLCPGGGLFPLRAWPIAHYGQTARRLIERGFVVGIVGVPQDRNLATSIRAACASEACVDLTGYTSTVRDLVVLLHLGSLLVTNDGGTGHFAALTPIPTIALYGPETPNLYGNLSEYAVNLSKPLSCAPCLTAYNHRRSPCDGDNVCLKSISPEEVLATADKLLQISSPTGNDSRGR
jgi:lipopolysaccharide heptosyltransferase II